MDFSHQVKLKEPFSKWDVRFVELNQRFESNESY